MPPSLTLVVVSVRRWSAWTTRARRIDSSSATRTAGSSVASAVSMTSFGTRSRGGAVPSKRSARAYTAEAPRSRTSSTIGRTASNAASTSNSARGSTARSARSVRCRPRRSILGMTPVAVPGGRVPELPALPRDMPASLGFHLQLPLNAVQPRCPAGRGPRGSGVVELGVVGGSGSPGDPAVALPQLLTGAPRQAEDARDAVRVTAVGRNRVEGLGTEEDAGVAHGRGQPPGRGEVHGVLGPDESERLGRSQGLHRRGGPQLGSGVRVPELHQLDDPL